MKTRKDDNTVIIMVIVAIIMILSIVFTGCSGEYWHGTRTTASGKHERYSPGWGGGCPTFSQPQYIHSKNYNKYADWKRR